MKRLLFYILIFILLIAGVVHLVRPELFLIAMPPYIPWHLEIVYITGVIEIVLAVGIYLKKYRYRAAKICALYFIAIMPAHIHVAINAIEMFGINNPYVLWGRTLFQFVFITWAWKLRNYKEEK